MQEFKDYLLFAVTGSVIPRSAGTLPGRAGPLSDSEAAGMDQP
jgi:hypothetical protein